MKETWEKRRDHNCDFVDSQFISRGLTPPIHPPGQCVQPKVNVVLWSVIKGKEFWEEFSKRGHDQGSFERCKCRR